MKNRKQLFLTMVFMFCTMIIAAPSIQEGTGTTDADGFGLGSLFQIQVKSIPIKFRDSIIDYRGDTTISFNGRVLAHYAFDSDWCSGYFNLSFDEIWLAPDTVYYEFTGTEKLHNCFVVKDTINNTCSKLQVIDYQGGNRFRYRYLTNHTPGSRLLLDTMASPESRAQVKKVTNVFFTGIRYSLNPGTDEEHTKWLLWDSSVLSPAAAARPSSIQYVLYRTIDDIEIDTTKPVDRSQWVPVDLFSDSPVFVDNFPYNGYVNMVAVINRDTSEFLTGWTLCRYSVLSTRDDNCSRQNKPGGMTIQKSSTGRTVVTLSHEYDTDECGCLNIFDLKGTKIASLPFTGKTVYLDNDRLSLCTGGYVLKAIVPGKETAAARFFTLEYR